jgi:iron complex outermembrane recepter protein
MPGMSLTARVDNALNRRYHTAGALGENAFAAGAFVADADAWRRDTFMAAAAPRSVWMGLKVDW